MSPDNRFRVAIVLSLFLPVFADVPHCSNGFREEAAKKINITSCRKQSLGAEFAWNYNNGTRRLEILFGAKLHGDMGWLAWGLNPGKHAGMVGTQALIGIKLSNGTSSHDTYSITDSTKLGCKLLPSKIDLEVGDFSFSFPEAEFAVIQATIVLPREYNDSSTNVVWQVGNVAAEKQPFMHPKNIWHLSCKETINLISGSVRGDGAHKLQKLRKVHGILNIVGWGSFLPVGAIIARYFRRFPVEWSQWFRLHVSCQILGYLLGTSGWIIGLWLGNASKYYGYHTHRVLGIIIFTFTTLQMFALRLKPKRNDDYRVYWNMYHHFLGYSLLAIISVNIFHGISILNADHTWKWAYIGLLCLLGSIAVVLEIYTWIKFWKRESPGIHKTQDQDQKDLQRGNKNDSGASTASHS
ncbi:cytochrome b561 and DOMON domain-containing protein At4g12980 [Coffea arabica]|uniref:Cytochrome b561 and DOMON domain-containing protein n=2 Tax=Coffea TaxID=13442 RepID=A0A6P6S860_COFAR|nr:cytochrome b561 and DOMON domain-containing protein At4g12980-like [Coffea arabica]